MSKTEKKILKYLQDEIDKYEFALDPLCTGNRTNAPLYEARLQQLLIVQFDISEIIDACSLHSERVAKVGNTVHQNCPGD